MQVPQRHETVNKRRHRNSVVAALITSTLQRDGYPAESGYIIGFALVIGLAIAALVISFLVPKPQPGASADPEPVEDSPRSWKDGIVISGR
jgi:predicted exporter